jgi:hypothetical protein
VLECKHGRHSTHTTAVLCMQHMSQLQQQVLLVVEVLRCCIVLQRYVAAHKHEAACIHQNALDVHTHWNIHQHVPAYMYTDPQCMQATLCLCTALTLLDSNTQRKCTALSVTDPIVTCSVTSTFAPLMSLCMMQYLCVRAVVIATRFRQATIFVRFRTHDGICYSSCLTLQSQFTVMVHNLYNH